MSFISDSLDAIGLGGGGGTEMVTDPHSAWLSQSQQDMWDMSTDEQGNFNTAPTYDPNSQFGQAMSNSLAGNPAQRLDANNWGMMNAGQVENYWEANMKDPAMRRYETETRPAWMSKLSNLHGSHRANMEQSGYEDLMSGLESQRGDLQYQNTLRNQQMMQGADMSNAQMGQQAQMQAMGMNAQYDPQQQMLAMMSGQTPTSQVVQQPSDLQQLSTLASIPGAFM